MAEVVRNVRDVHKGINSLLFLDGSIVVTGEYASGNQEEGTMVIEQGKQVIRK